MAVPRLSASVLLSLTEKALKRVESSLRSAMGANFHIRRTKSAEVRKPRSREQTSAQSRSATAKSTTGSRKKQKSPIMREIKGLEFDLSRDVVRPTSGVFNYLRPVEGLVRPHVDDSGRSRARTSQILIDRMNFKLVKRHKSKAARKEQEEPIQEDPGKDLDAVLHDLRQRVQKMKVRESHKMSNAKQMMTEFSGFGSRVLKKSNGGRPLSSGDSSTKELMNIIELIDARLSTSEALAVLKEIGINYEPRTAAGKKNATAAALAAGGLKLGSNETVEAVEEN
jgi:hypothetical protein